MKPVTTKPAFYLRVSTGSQEFDSQLHALKEYCKRGKLPAPAKGNLFSEKVSGAKAKRTELDLLLQACREGRFDTIITYRGDRLSRSVEHMSTVYAELEHLRVRVIGIADGIDTAADNPSTRLLRNLLASTAQFHREITVENILAGLKAAKARGVRLGRPGKQADNIVTALRMVAGGCQRREACAHTKISYGYLTDVLCGRRVVDHPAFSTWLKAAVAQTKKPKAKK